MTGNYYSLSLPQEYAFPAERYDEEKPTAIQMIDRCTIKFRPALSQKELEKGRHDDGQTQDHTNLTKIEQKIEFVGDFSDVRKVSELLKKLSKPPQD